MTSIFGGQGQDAAREQALNLDQIGRTEYVRLAIDWPRQFGSEVFGRAPDRLLDSIIDDALAAAVSRLNQYLNGKVSVDIGAVDLTPIRDQLRAEVAARLTETGVAVDPNDPVITSIISRYAEILNGFLQTEGLHVERYIWRSRDDSRVRAAHAGYDDHIFSWSDPPEGGHPGQGWNCRCTADLSLITAQSPTARPATC